MCLSAHEMTSSRIEAEIEMMQGWIASGRLSKNTEMLYERRIEKFQALLKGRAEDGTYHDDTDRR